MLSVPPYEARWGPSDVIAGHYRRYEPARLLDLLVASGFDEPRVSLYGFPLGFALQTARNVLARVSPTDGSIAERTAASGRWHQPPDWLAPVTQAATAPFRVLQRPFLNTRLGTGLFAVARRRD